MPTILLRLSHLCVVVVFNDPSSGFLSFVRFSTHVSTSYPVTNRAWLSDVLVMTGKVQLRQVCHTRIPLYRPMSAAHLNDI